MKSAPSLSVVLLVLWLSVHGAPAHAQQPSYSVECHFHDGGASMLGCESLRRFINGQPAGLGEPAISAGSWVQATSYCGLRGSGADRVSYCVGLVTLYSKLRSAPVASEARIEFKRQGLGAYEGLVEREAILRATRKLRFKMQSAGGGRVVASAWQ